MTSNRKVAWLLIAFVASLFLWAPEVFAQASTQTEFEKTTSHWKEGIKLAISLVVYGFVGVGIVVMAISVWTWIALSKGTANQMQQNAGYKGVFAGLGGGAILVGLSWWVGVMVGAFTGTSASDNAALEDLLQGDSRPVVVEQLKQVA